MSVIPKMIASRPDGAAGPVRQVLPWALVGLCGVALAGYIAVDWRYGLRLHAAQGPEGSSTAPSTAASGASEKQAAPAQATSVTLSESKFKQAGIAIEPARVDRLSTEVGVVGQVRENSDRQVEVRPWASARIREVHVQLGQKVKKGDMLAILDSPEVGKARLDLRARQRELATARFEARWKSQISENVQSLIPALEKYVADDIAHRHEPDRKEQHDEEAQHQEQGRPARNEALEMRFAGKDLGAYRGMLLKAFADYEIAVHEEFKNIDLQRQKIVGQHMVVIARHTREGSQAGLTGAIEQARYDSAQERRIAEQMLRQAEAAVVDAAQRLRILGVHEDINHLLEHPEEASKLATTEDVTRYQIDAPFDGQILKKNAVPSQKADMNDVLFVLADLSNVWVKADVSESDVPKLTRLADGKIGFRVTAYGDREFKARLISIGSVVDPQTRTVPILAVADNPESVLKVGMFARILLDSSAVEKELTVPAASVIEIETAKFVFVPTNEPRTYKIRPVSVGRRTGERTVIKGGLSEGEPVVSAGAFFLKSELILQNSDDEE